MAFPRHWLFTFGGTLADRDEWVCGIRMRLADGFAPPPDGVAENAAMEAYEPLLRALFTDPGMMLTSQADLRFLKLNEIGPEGRYANQSQTFRRDLTTPIPGSSSRTVPLDQALCVTLLTSAQRGKASKGRFYLPGTTQTLEQTGTFTASACQAMAASLATFLNGLAPSDLTGGLEPAVVSPGVQSDPEGGSRRVSGVQVGNQPDRQRRRRENTPEVYYRAAVTT